MPAMTTPPPVPRHPFLHHTLRAGLARLALAALCLGTGAQAAPLNLAVSNGPVSLLVYVAQANGYFQREGVEVAQRECSSGRQCMAMVNDGTNDVATAADLVSAVNSFNRPDGVVLATLSASSYQIKLVGRRSAGVSTPGQLRGKRVATAPGTSAQYFLNNWLLFYAIDPASITLVPLAPDALGNALEHRDVDAIAIWEPLASNALRLLGEDGVTLPVPRVYTQHFNLVSTRAAVAARRADLVKLLRALVQAQQFIQDNPEGAARTLMHRLGLSLPAAQAQLKEHDYRVRLDQSLISTLSSQIRWAVREGQVQAPASATPPNPLQVVEPALLREASAAAVNFVK